jgi:ABC-2 type transport system permease protein
MKTFLIARKTLRESLREPQLLLLTLIFPLFMMIVGAIGYSASPKLISHPILILDNSSQADSLIARLKARHYADGRPTFDLKFITDRAAAEIALKAQTASALVILGADNTGDLTVTMHGDATSMRFITASSLLQQVIGPYLDQAAGMPTLLRFSETPISITMPQSDFDAYAPGMMIMAILLLTPHVAMVVAREIRYGTLRRLRLTPLAASELLSGVTLAEMLIASVQIVFMFIAALILGFHNNGSLVIAIGVGLLLSFSAIGFGLLVACFSSSDSDALNIGALVSMLQVFLCGAFFALPSSTLFTLNGHEIGVFDFLPATHGMLALQQVLSGQARLSDIAFRLAAMTSLAILYFAIGILVFGRRQMRQQA